MDSAISLSMPGMLLLAVVFLSAGCGVTWLVLRSRLEQMHRASMDREAELRESQKSIHERERAFLEERNQTEIRHADAVQKAKAEANEQGRKLGRVEGESQHLEAIMALKSEFSARLTAEVDVAVTEARRRLTAEYELQTKLFTVQISPLVRITEDKGMFSSVLIVETGYQYQLLVNGIPAFQPHVIIERTESRKQVNEENIRQLAGWAKDCAQAAIDMYLGAGGGKFAKLAPLIFEKLSKSDRRQGSNIQ